MPPSDGTSGVFETPFSPWHCKHRARRSSNTFVSPDADDTHTSKIARMSKRKALSRLIAAHQREPDGKCGGGSAPAIHRADHMP